MTAARVDRAARRPAGGAARRRPGRAAGRRRRRPTWPPATCSWWRTRWCPRPRAGCAGWRRSSPARTRGAIARAQGKDPRLVQAVLDETVRVLRAEPRRADLRDPPRASSAPTPASTARTRPPGRGGAAARGPRRLGAGPARGIAARRRPARGDRRLLRPRVAARADRRGRRRRRACVPLDDWRGRADAAGRALRGHRDRGGRRRGRARPTWRAPRTRASRPCWCAGSSAS